MRVLHVIPGIARRYGGPSYAIAGICKALRADGVDAEIATTDADGPHDTLAPEVARAMFGDVPVRMFHRDAGESLKYSRQLAKWLGAHVKGYDVVHIHSIFSHASVAASREASRAGVPFIVRPLGHLDPWSMSLNALRKKIFLRWFCSDLLQRAALFHYTTLEEQNLAAAIVSAPSFVAPLGVDEALFAPVEPAVPNGRYVLSIGRIHSKKNLDALIRAFAEAAGDSGWRLRIAGEGDRQYSQQLKDAARDAGIADRVEFLSWIDGDAKRDLLRRASLFALPSSQENFGISAAEAMAAGVPVVVTRAVNLAQDVIAGEAGWVVDLGDLARALREAMADDAEREKRGRAARALAFSKYRWSAAAQILREAYDRVLRSSVRAQ